MFVNVQIISMRLTLWMKKVDVFAVRKAKSVVLIQGDSQNVQINVLKIMLQMQRVSFISHLAKLTWKTKKNKTEQAVQSQRLRNLC